MGLRKVSATRGSDAPVVDGKTFDGMSLEKLADIAERARQMALIASGRSGGFISRRTATRDTTAGYPHGGRPLVQEAVRILLEAIYEPVFLNESHGFRRGDPVIPRSSSSKGRVGRAASGWSVDVRGFFDNIDHDILLGLQGSGSMTTGLSV